MPEADPRQIAALLTRRGQQARAERWVRQLKEPMRKVEALLGIADALVAP